MQGGDRKELGVQPYEVHAVRGRLLLGHPATRITNLEIRSRVCAREPVRCNSHTCKPPPRRAYRVFLRKGLVTGYGGIA